MPTEISLDTWGKDRGGTSRSNGVYGTAAALSSCWSRWERGQCRLFSSYLRTQSIRTGTQLPRTAREGKTRKVQRDTGPHTSGFRIPVASSRRCHSRLVEFHMEPGDSACHRSNSAPSKAHMVSTYQGDIPVCTCDYNS